MRIPHALLPIAVLLTAAATGGAARAQKPECLRQPARVTTERDAAAHDPWTLKLTWSGGFFGQFPKSITVAASGHATVPASAGCLGADGRAAFDKLLAAARPEEWHACYGTNPCCDRFSYSLDLKQPRDSRAYHLSWYSGDDESMPPDLRQLVTALTALGSTKLPACPAVK